MSRNTRRLLAWVVTGLVAAGVLVVAWWLVATIGWAWALVVLSLGAVLTRLPRFWGPWHFVLFPEQDTSLIAAFRAMWRWADRGRHTTVPTIDELRPPEPGSGITERPSPPRW